MKIELGGLDAGATGDLIGTVAPFAVEAMRLPQSTLMTTSAIGLFPPGPERSETLRTALLENALVTSWFVVVDTRHRTMFLDQSYADVEKILPVRFQIDQATFRLHSDPICLEGDYIVLGGPIDTVWYHWLFNWCPRLLVLKMLRPDLIVRPKAKVLVSPLALEPPYRDILDTFGIAAERFVVAEPGSDYLIERAHLVSFLDQQKLYPSIVRSFASHLRQSFGLGDERHAGVFASRQPLPAPRRRIANFESIEPVLRNHGLRIAALGDLRGHEQAALFAGADLVVGAHGSDLSNILFCRPGTPVIVIENEASVRHGLHVGLERVAAVLDLRYQLLISDTTHEPCNGMPVSVWQSRDYVVDPQVLDRMIASAREGRDLARSAE